MAWATLMKMRKALVEHTGEIYARRNPPASGENPIKGEDLSPAQLESVTAEMFEYGPGTRAYHYLLSYAYI